MMSNNFHTNSDIDFSNIDTAIKNLVLTIADINKKKGKINFSNSEYNIKPKRPIKKLNIELIKKVLMETKEIQEKKKEHK